MRYRSKTQMVLHGQLDSTARRVLWFNMDEELTATDHAASRRHEPTLHFTISLRRLSWSAGREVPKVKTRHFCCPRAKQAALPLSFP